ncbi:MAG: hypothetical protein JXR42_00900 [Gammaproteobacteria bacterium]|nr:hypothetical protein [Gammaproteobacteria bacterium]
MRFRGVDDSAIWRFLLNKNLLITSDAVNSLTSFVRGSRHKAINSDMLMQFLGNANFLRCCDDKLIDSVFRFVTRCRLEVVGIKPNEIMSLLLRDNGAIFETPDKIGELVGGLRNAEVISAVGIVKRNSGKWLEFFPIADQPEPGLVVAPTELGMT